MVSNRSQQPQQQQHQHQRILVSSSKPTLPRRVLKRHPKSTDEAVYDDEFYDDDDNDDEDGINDEDLDNNAVDDDDDDEDLSGGSSTTGKSTGIGGGTLPIRPTLSARSVTNTPLQKYFIIVFRCIFLNTSHHKSPNLYKHIIHIAHPPTILTLDAQNTQKCTYGWLYIYCRWVFCLILCSCYGLSGLSFQSFFFSFDLLCKFSSID